MVRTETITREVNGQTRNTDVELKIDMDVLDHYGQVGIHLIGVDGEIKIEGSCKVHEGTKADGVEHVLSGAGKVLLKALKG